ncbi:alpha/beta hydrolase [Glycomyces sp. NPDC021274]|uniref:alpha/beta hydrolase n=1 Tax=Glycomyces sp. NPDC021274 TaxID=3155120 RepID=UPI0033E5EB83
MPMPISYQALIEADIDALQAVGEAWLQVSKDLEEHLATLDDYRTGDLKADNWDGDSAEAGRTRIKEFAADLDERAAQARRVAAAVEDACSGFRTSQNGMTMLAGMIDKEQASLSADGTVVPNTAKGTAAVDYASGMQSQVNAHLEDATAADEALKAAVALYAETLSTAEEAVLDQLAAEEVGALQDLIDDGASPEEVNEWWNSLSGEEQIAMLENHPELLGGLDGVPTDTRDYANRELLEAELDRFSPTLDADIVALQAEIDQFNDGAKFLNSSYDAMTDELERLEAERDRRDGLNSLQDAIREQAATGQDFYLLGYDSAGDGKAIVSVGNPDTADNTAVYVPGTGADLSGASGGLLDRAETMALDAGDIPGSGETAVVMWLGYDAPDNPALDSPRMSYAEDASAPLSSFMSGLESTNADPDGTNTTVVGHSYGTTVIGQSASEHGLATDNIVAVASPGMVVENASELGIDPDNFYATVAPGDMINPVAETGALGPDPTDGGVNFDIGAGTFVDWHGFGGNTFTSDNMEGNAKEIHSNYWDEGNPARENLALIFTGNGDQAS